VGDAVKALAKPEVVEAAGEAVRRLLVDGRITLVPNAEYTGVVGPAHFKELGDHLLELAGARRRCNL